MEIVSKTSNIDSDKTSEIGSNDKDVLIQKRVLVFGNIGSGKTSLIKSLTGISIQMDYMLNVTECQLSENSKFKYSFWDLKGQDPTLIRLLLSDFPSIVLFVIRERSHKASSMDFEHKKWLDLFKINPSTKVILIYTHLDEVVSSTYLGAFRIRGYYFQTHQVSNKTGEGIEILKKYLDECATSMLNHNFDKKSNNPINNKICQQISYLAKEQKRLNPIMRYKDFKSELTKKLINEIDTETIQSFNSSKCIPNEIIESGINGSIWFHRENESVITNDLIVLDPWYFILLFEEFFGSSIPCARYENLNQEAEIIIYDGLSFQLQRKIIVNYLISVGIMFQSPLGYIIPTNLPGIKNFLELQNTYPSLMKYRAFRIYKTSEPIPINLVSNVCITNALDFLMRRSEKEISISNADRDDIQLFGNAILYVKHRVFLSIVYEADRIIMYTTKDSNMDFVKSFLKALRHTEWIYSFVEELVCSNDRCLSGWVVGTSQYSDTIICQEHGTPFVDSENIEYSGFQHPFYLEKYKKLEYPKTVKLWTFGHVEKWIVELKGLSKNYSTDFLKGQINGRVLLKLEKTDLEDFIENKKDLEIVLNSIEELKKLP